MRRKWIDLFSKEIMIEFSSMRLCLSNALIESTELELIQSINERLFQVEYARFKLGRLPESITDPALAHIHDSKKN